MFVLHHGPKGSLPLMPAALLFLCLLSVSAGAADWPQWRGPERDGISPEKDLLQAWPEEGLTLLWKTHGLGKGFSSLAIAGRRIFTMGDLVDSQYLFALDAKRGRYLWKAKVGPAFANRYAGPRSTPTVNGDRVYALGTEGDLICADTATGEVKWRKSLPRDFGGKMMTHWKFSESPLADGDRVVVTPGGKEAALVALNKRGGAEIWRAAIPKLGSKGKDGAGYSSIVVSEGAGIRQYVQLMGRGVVSVEASTGRFLWGYNRVANGTANVATPLVDGDYVFASTGYGTGSVLLRLSPAGNDIRAEEVYFVEGGTLQNHHGGLIMHGGHVYGGTGHKRGYPICLELQSGKLIWGPMRNAGNGSAAVSYADGHLYFRYQDGLMMLLEATPEGYHEKGSFMIPEVEDPSWSHPVISGGRLYLREQDNLFVYDIQSGKRSAQR